MYDARVVGVGETRPKRDNKSYLLFRPEFLLEFLKNSAAACRISTGKVGKHLHCVAKVYAVLPFYDVKCLCSRGRD